ncbi:MAG: arabinofuranosidase catalytic domain-containing protein [Polyangiaceae bacterium]
MPSSRSCSNPRTVSHECTSLRAAGAQAVRWRGGVHRSAAARGDRAGPSDRSDHGGDRGKVAQATTKNIGLLAPGVFADSAAQDSFCTGTECTISILAQTTG